MVADRHEVSNPIMTTAITRSKRTKTIDAIVAARTPRLGLSYKVGNALGLDVVGNPTFDTSEMWAAAVISTPTIDRVGDMLMPKGCLLTNYDKNPSVMWNHGFDLTLPIATSRAPDGSLAVFADDSQVSAKSWFSKSLKEAAQIFELIVEGIVKATSVRETPIVSSYKRDPDFGEILLVEEWELEEWSWVPVGCNPDAIAKALHHGKLAGSQIAESVLKSLLPLAPKLTRPGKGLALEANEMAKPYTGDEIKAMDDAGLEQAKADCDPASMKMVEDEQKRRKAEPPTEEEPPVEGGEEEPEADMGTPYGAQLLTAIHAALADAVGNIESGLGPLENPDVKQALTDLVGTLSDAKMAVEGLYSSSYPEGKGLKAEGGDAEGEALKSFLASGRLPQLQMGGVGARLKGLASAKNLQPAQRKALIDAMRHLDRLVSQAKAAKAPAKPQQPDEAQLKAMQTKLDELKALLPTGK